MLPFIEVAFRQWSADVGDAKERSQKFGIHVTKTDGGALVSFIAQREPQEIGLKGGRCKNGQDVRYEITDDLLLKKTSYFK